MTLLNNKFFSHARTAALCSPGTGKRKVFKLGAILVYKNKIVSSGFNSKKTHPLLAKITEYPFLHAESSTILKYGIDECEGMNLYVIRLCRKFPIGLSKPCEVCMDFIKAAKIAKVYYSINSNEYGTIKLL
jgi:deoxycytidylate deaminase